MSAETLLTAAHRLSRYFHQDMARGGMVVDETMEAYRILDKLVKDHEAAKLPEDELLRSARAAANGFHRDMTTHGGLSSNDTELLFIALDKVVASLGGRK